MIEVIGVRETDTEELQWREMPKNLRQMGEIRGRKKIYIEDYVVTYLSRLAKPDQAYARGAVLMGNVFRIDGGEAVFVSGALEAQNLEFDMDETVFNKEIWDDILAAGKKYFPEQRVVGWFLSRMGFSVEINQKIIETHKKNFPGSHSLLYMMDALEREDAMYLCENGQMIRQKGYYIYYEKNDAMQEYMSGKGERSEKTQRTNTRGPVAAEKPGDRTVERYRKKNKRKKEGQRMSGAIRFIRAACLFLIFVMGMVLFRQMGDRTGFFSEMGETMIETIGHAVRVIRPEDTEVVEEVWKEEEKVTEEATERKESQQEETAEAAEETKEAAAPVYYIVQKGDTLAKISRKMYMTDKYMKQIAWANGLEDANQIYVGQKILIPALE